MAYIFLASLLFCVSVMAHVFFCRSRPKTEGLHVKAYVVMVILFMGTYAAGAYGLGKIFDPDSLWGLPLKLTGGVIYLLLAPIYLCFYTLTQLMSPSKKILLSLSRSRALSYADILARIEEEEFITTRLNDLRTSGCIEQTHNRLTLTAAGQKIVVYLNIMQKILGRNIGG